MTESSSTVRELLIALRAGELTRVEAVEGCLRRIENHADLNAFLWADGDRIVELASRGGPAGRPLGGLPLALKDNIGTAGIPTTSGSAVDMDRIPLADATVWARLRDRAGAILAGKAHMCEFGYRAHHPQFGRVCNPVNLARASGGSSSGSAASVAAGLVPAALGTDTGGSIRIPSAYCGVVGLKASSGLVDTDGVVPLSRTMDHVGVMSRNITDAAIVLEQMANRPLKVVDPITLEVTRPAPRDVRIGIDQDYFLSEAQPEVKKCWRDAVQALEAAGCRLVPVQIEDAARWREAHHTILILEAWRFHAKRILAGAPYGAIFRDAISTGASFSDSSYHDALRTRVEARATLAQSLAPIDALLTPTCPTVAPPGEEGHAGTTYTRYTTLAAFTGFPAVTLPAGTGAHGLPVGVQLTAAPESEPRLIAIAALLEDCLSTAGS